MALMSLTAFQEISTEDLISSARSWPGGTKFISRIASRQLRSSWEPEASIRAESFRCCLSLSRGFSTQCVPVRSAVLAQCPAFWILISCLRARAVEYN
jgi:hypothetical protein